MYQLPFDILNTIANNTRSQRQLGYYAQMKMLHTRYILYKTFVSAVSEPQPGNVGHQIS